MDILRILCNIKSRSDLNISIKLILDILIVYNCRISEILNADWKNYKKNYFMILKGLKHSNDIVIRDRAILKIIDSITPYKEGKIFSHISYRTIYNIIKKDYSHLFEQFKTNKNYKVTHAFRYLAASQADDQDELKVILHHNSIRSGKYYNKKLYK